MALYWVEDRRTIPWDVVVGRAGGAEAAHKLKAAGLVRYASKPVEGEPSMEMVTGLTFLLDRLRDEP